MLYGRYNKEADVWSMGVIIFQMLTGEYPFDAFRDNDLKELILIGDYEEPPNITENAKDLLLRMIEYRNDKRITFKDCLQHPWFQKASNK